MSYEVSQYWTAGPRVKISELRKGDQCVDIQGRTLTIGHTHNNSCVFATDNIGIETCYSASAEVVKC